MKATHQQFAFAGVVRHVAHGVNAGQVGGKGGWIHGQLFAFQLQSPLGQRPQAWGEAQTHQQHIQRQAQHTTVWRVQFEGREPRWRAWLLLHVAGHANGYVDVACCAQVVQLFQQLGWGVEHVAPVLQRGARRALCGGCRGTGNGLGHGLWAATVYHHPLARQGGQIAQVVEHLPAAVGLQTGQLERARHKRPHACSDEYRTRVQLGALLGAHLPAACSQGLQRAHLLAQVLHRGERRHLLWQALHQLVRAAHGQGGDVVNRLVAIQLHALAARVGQSVDEVGAQALQAQLKYQEQANRPSTDHHGIGGDGRGWLGDG